MKTLQSYIKADIFLTLPESVQYLSINTYPSSFATAKLMLNIFLCAHTIPHPLVQAIFQIIVIESQKGLQLKIVTEFDDENHYAKAFYNNTTNMIVFNENSMLSQEDLSDQTRVFDDCFSSFIHEGFHKVTQCLGSLDNEVLARGLSIKNYESTIKEANKFILQHPKDDYPAINSLKGSVSDIDFYCYEDGEDEFLARIIECISIDELHLVSERTKIEANLPKSCHILYNGYLPLMQQYCTVEHERLDFNKASNAAALITAEESPDITGIAAASSNTSFTERLALERTKESSRDMEP